MLVGLIALTGQFWLDNRSPGKQDVAAHVVNLAWHGLEGLRREPRIHAAAPPRARRSGDEKG
jgi:hypothetical protein